jgi:hypothetical protein
VKVSAKLGNPITKETINSICRSCGNNNACQNQKLVDKIEHGAMGESNGPEQSGPQKTR